MESRDTLNSIALKFDTTPNELVQLNKLFSRAVVPGKVLYGVVIFRADGLYVQLIWPNSYFTKWELLFHDKDINLVIHC